MNNNKIWMRIALIAIVICVVLGIMLVVNNNDKGSGEVKQTENKATAEDVKIVKNEASTCYKRFYPKSI